MIWLMFACFLQKNAENTTPDTSGGIQDSGFVVEDVVSNVCSTDADCGTGVCINVVDGNSDVRVCQHPVDVWRYECSSEDMGCCSDEDCQDGVCAAMEINYCGGPAPAEENQCVTQECMTDVDCDTGLVCLDSGVVGSVTGICIVAQCMQNSDCPGEYGRCSLVYNDVTCPGLQLTCTDRDSPCRWYGDCDNGWLCVGDSTGVSCLEEMMPP